MKVRDVIKRIETDGWYYVGTEGSHRQFKHSAKRGKVTVPGHPSDEVAPGTLANIWRQAGLKNRDEGETKMNPQNEYLVILEPADRNWSAYCPDVLGCISTGPTREQTRRNFADALQGHLDWMREDNDSIPPPVAEADFLAVALPGQPPRRYLAILQPTPLGAWSATPADVPDLVLEFSDRDGALRLLHAALQSHLAALLTDGQPVPEPASEAATVAVRESRLPVAA